MVEAWQMEAYERLRTEIVKSAVKDLQKAIRKSNKLGFVCDDQKRMEAWFLSKWGQFLCEDNGEYMVQRCRETYKRKTPKLNRRHTTEDVQRQICKEYKNGVGYKEIMRKYNISAPTLYSIVRRWE